MLHHGIWHLHIAGGSSRSSMSTRLEPDPAVLPYSLLACLWPSRSSVCVNSHGFSPTGGEKCKKNTASKNNGVVYKWQQAFLALFSKLQYPGREKSSSIPEIQSTSIEIWYDTSQFLNAVPETPALVVHCIWTAVACTRVSRPGRLSSSRTAAMLTQQKQVVVDGLLLQGNI